MKPPIIRQPRTLPIADHRQGLYIIFGAHAASSTLLKLSASLSLSQTVRILDCGNRANMYTVAKELRRLTNDPAAAMNRITLSRAFTCYQVEALLNSVRSFRNAPVLVLDLLATFFDESVNNGEIQRLYRNSLSSLREISRSNIVIIGVKGVPARAQERSALLASLRDAADDFVIQEVPVASLCEFDEQLTLF